MFKREFTGIKLLFLLMILLGITADIICHKANGISVSCYIIGTVGFFCPANILRKL